MTQPGERKRLRWRAAWLACGEGSARLVRVAAFSVALGLSSCSSGPSVQDAVDAYEVGEYPRALEVLRECRAADADNRHLFSLEESVVRLAAGEPAQAVSVLRKARDRLDELSGLSLGEQVSSYLLDDRQRDWEGADFENVLVRVMLALSELMSSGSGRSSDVEAYSLQVLERQQEIVRAYEGEEDQNPKTEYRLVAFGSYLRGLLKEENPLQLDVARLSFQKALELIPDLVPAQEGLRRVDGGQHSAKGFGVVYVFALLGRGPYRVEREEVASTQALSLAKLLWAVIRGNIALPEIRAVPIPGLAFHRDNPHSMTVEVVGPHAAGAHPSGRTQMVTDIEDLARTEFALMQNSVVARAIVRRALKIVVVEGGKEGFRKNIENENARLVADLGASIAGLIWTSSEKADLRCWNLLPATIQVLRLELKVGEHELVLRAEGAARSGAEQRVAVEVRDGRNTYVLAIAPTTSGGPAPLTSFIPYSSDSPSLETPPER